MNCTQPYISQTTRGEHLSRKCKCPRIKDFQCRSITGIPGLLPNWICHSNTHPEFLPHCDWHRKQKEHDLFIYACVMKGAFKSFAYAGPRILKQKKMLSWDSEFHLSQNSGKEKLLWHGMPSRVLSKQAPGFWSKKTLLTLQPSYCQ